MGHPCTHLSCRHKKNKMLSSTHENVDLPIDEMKYVKLRKCKLQQDELLFPPSESGNRRETICDKGGAQKIHKVTAKFVEAMQRVIVARDQLKKKQQPPDGTSKMG
ncbi:unnamed protein product [Dovyalis caffra]|uniref:Uncharacterized protein n=1 Tax=Dovyalis caffra TaxID=77055 RepID=A0AAV1QTY2_9ROSI|nr:unnamed protein product [Dovyalis caffra]